MPKRQPSGHSVQAMQIDRTTFAGLAWVTPKEADMIL
jgi:hypothetical protein